MDGQELIQVNLQLPASALDSLSVLAEQLRQLTEAVKGLRQPEGSSEEAMESGSFDPERFQALRQRSEDLVRQDLKAEAQAVRPEVSDAIREPDCAWQKLEMEYLPEQAPVFPQDEGQPPKMTAEAANSAMEQTSEDIPAVRPEIETGPPDAPVVRAEADSQILTEEEIQMRTGDAEIPLPAVREDVTAGGETPLGAGLVVTSQPEPPVNRWSGLTEELTVAGPAPLTAEAVSLAFQRDGRRYDNGFPLY